MNRASPYVFFLVVFLFLALRASPIKVSLERQEVAVQGGGREVGDVVFIYSNGQLISTLPVDPTKDEITLLCRCITYRGEAIVAVDCIQK